MFRFAIDRGGTFTDVYAEVPREPPHNIIVLKLLSVDPNNNYSDAPTEAIRLILQQVTGEEMKRGEKIRTDKIEWIRMGTTIATNALLERNGRDVGFVTTKGFRDVLRIGNQSRSKIFDLEMKKPKVLYKDVVEINERVHLFHPRQDENAKFSKQRASTGEIVEVLEEPAEEHIESQLLTLQAKGIDTLSVALMNSHIYPHHEEKVKKVADRMGFKHVSLSSSLSPIIKLVPRGETGCVNGYVGPLIEEYIEKFISGFDEGIKSVPILFMKSDGGLATVRLFHGFSSLLSGPAGGVVGYGMTTPKRFYENGGGVIGFDMGGTSTDVSRYDGSSFDHVYDAQISGICIQSPQLDISTVAAGGGSKLFFRSGRFVVGPESAGADPGPICYRKLGGHSLTVTDANLYLGRLVPSEFPAIFGPSQDQPLDEEATRVAFNEQSRQINEYLSAKSLPVLSVDEIVYGFLKVANETMCRPIRAITQAKGYSPSMHALASFGGAGGQHACEVARSLGMKKVFIHRYSGILSAYGLSIAHPVYDQQEPCAMEYTQSNISEIERRLELVRKRVVEHLASQLSPVSSTSAASITNHIRTHSYLNLRYDGTERGKMIRNPSEDGTHGDYLSAFKLKYKKEYGFLLSEDRKVLVDDVRVRASYVSPYSLQCPGSNYKDHTKQNDPKPAGEIDCYFGSTGRIQTKYYRLEDSKNTTVHGPAILIDKTSTILIDPNSSAIVTPDGDVEITIEDTFAKEDSKNGFGSDKADPIELSVFAHRFMSIAEQMGNTLQRTSVSTNIKERLDFSCAIFGADGGLVANAPHLPVHLGSMQHAVRWQIDHLKRKGEVWQEGDVVCTNHPAAGGSHLPDITVITPVFASNGSLDKSPVFYVASRGHHADIGGSTPGSMPPFSKTLLEEGAAIKSFCLVKANIFQENEISSILLNPSPEHSIPGTRNLSDNLSDLRAQVAANQKGISLMNELIQQYSLPVVLSYMQHVQKNAEEAVRDMLSDIAKQFSDEQRGGKILLSAEDLMDDGAEIKLNIVIDPSECTAVFDFSGSSYELYGNLNAPRSVTYSAIIYSLRCLVNVDIPLNEGCLKPITVIIPDGSILSPSDSAAVVGGNVLTSQRVTDVILSAFKACACSQGCMNNLTFGDSSMGYYETIAGGAGAGPSWNGESGVHSHMTNTRITDPEILEKRYPVLLTEFGIREDSGGKGTFNGGDGVVREIMFLKEMTVGILSERRSHAPRGMNGGENAKKGVNLLKTVDKTSGATKLINLGGKNQVNVRSGDSIRILTPGGGGYGGLFQTCK